MGCRDELSPSLGEGTNYWILLEKEGEIAGPAAETKLGNMRKTVGLSNGNLKGKSEGEEVKVK